MNYICRVLDYMAWFWFMEWLILVYIINRIIHGRLEIWNLSSRVHIRYLTRSLRSLVRYRCEHSKINSISPRDLVLFSIYHDYNYLLFQILDISLSTLSTLAESRRRKNLHFSVIFRLRVIVRPRKATGIEPKTSRSAVGTLPTELITLRLKTRAKL